MLSSSIHYCQVCHQVPKSIQKSPEETSSTDRCLNTDVERLVKMFEGTFIDPFNIEESPPHLLNIATGAVVPNAIADSLGGAVQVNSHCV